MKRGMMLAALLVVACTGIQSSEFHVSRKVPLPGEGGWDYLTVDGGARRLYVSHGTQVVVLDVDSLEIVGTIAGLSGVHGIAVAPEFGRGYISSGQADSVAVFELKTLKKITEIKVGKKPDAIVYDPATKQVFAMNGDGESSTVINAADNRVVGTVALGGGPEFTIADGKGNVFVNLEDKSELLRIDTKSLKVKDRWPVAPCQAPSSMAYDAINNRLFLGCRSRLLAVVNADNGKVVASYPIGEKVDASIFDPTTKLIFSSTGDGHVYGFRQDSADSYSALEIIPTAQGSKTMTMDFQTQKLLIPAREGTGVTLLILQK
jgi:DNA-binding beta-propeller fold protein YncE